MSSRYLDMMRSRSRQRGGITSKTILGVLAVICIGGSGIYWFRIQSVLTSDTVVAVVMTVIIVAAPPALISFLIPWSPAGMLLQKVNARTWAFPVIIGCGLFLLFYSYQMQRAWWMAQPVAVETNTVTQQVLMGLIGYVIIPALLFAPVSTDELVEQVRQAHLVKKYELQTQADIAILRSTLLRAQEKALIGFANLTIAERQELAQVMRALVIGIDRTLKETGQTVKTISGAALPFSGLLDDNDDMIDVLDYISESLTTTTMEDGEPPADERRVTIPRKDDRR